MIRDLGSGASSPCDSLDTGATGQQSTMIIDKKHIKTANKGNLKWLQGVIRNNPSVADGSPRASSAGIQSLRTPSVASVGGPPKLKECHWSEWKSQTPLPVPSPPMPSRPPTVSRSVSGSRNGRVCRSLPISPTAEFRLDDYNQRSDVVDIHPGYATPAEMKPDHRDPLSQAQAAPAQLSMDKLRESQFQDNDTAFVPALKAWVSNANPYERDVAYQLLHSVNISGPNSKVVKDCFKAYGYRKPPSPAPREFQTEYFRPSTAGVKTKPAHMTAPHIEQRYINEMGKLMARAAPRTPTTYRKQTYPLGKHIESNSARSTKVRDLVFEKSMFQPSKGPMKSHFVVHPEWLSEAPDFSIEGPLMKTTRGQKAIRYCSKKC